MKKYIYTYLTTNLINGKRYVGSHASDKIKDGYLGSGRVLLKAINKYGKDNFKREVLCLHKDRLEAHRYEGIFIHGYCTLHPHGYNLSPRGGVSPMGPHTRLPNNKPSWAKGYTKETHPAIARASESSIGQVFSKERRAEICIENKNNTRAKGNKWSDESRAKRGKAVLQYDLDGNFIKEWFNLHVAGDGVDGDFRNISTCARGKLNTAYGFKWKFKHDNNGYMIEQRSINGDLVRVWDDVKDAASHVDRSPIGIRSALRGDMHTCAGYKWVKVNK